MPVCRSYIVVVIITCNELALVPVCRSYIIISSSEVGRGHNEVHVQVCVVVLLELERRHVQALQRR